MSITKNSGAVVSKILNLLISQWQLTQNCLCLLIDVRVSIEIKSKEAILREELFYCMRAKKVPEKYVGIVKDVYTSRRTIMRSVAGNSASIDVKVGVHQGSALSPFLFTIMMDCLTALEFGNRRHGR